MNGITMISMANELIPILPEQPASNLPLNVHTT